MTELSKMQMAILMTMDGKYQWQSLPWNKNSIDNMDQLCDIGYVEKNQTDGIETYMLTQAGVDFLKEHYN